MDLTDAGTAGLRGEHGGLRTKTMTADREKYGKGEGGYHCDRSMRGVRASPLRCTSLLAILQK